MTLADEAAATVAALDAYDEAVARLTLTAGDVPELLALFEPALAAERAGKQAQDALLALADRFSAVRTEVLARLDAWSDRRELLARAQRWCSALSVAMTSGQSRARHAVRELVRRGKALRKDVAKADNCRDALEQVDRALAGAKQWMRVFENRR